VPRRERRQRVDEALAWIELEEVRTLAPHLLRRHAPASRGGAALLHRPRVLFLDEPTNGLDPQTRRNMWDKLAELRRRDGLTIFMTTHYMEERRAASRLAIIDGGRLVAEGSPSELRRAAGSEARAPRHHRHERAAAALAAFGVAPQTHRRGLDFAVDSGEASCRAWPAFRCPSCACTCASPRSRTPSSPSRATASAPRRRRRATWSAAPAACEGADDHRARRGPGPHGARSQALLAPTFAAKILGAIARPVLWLVLVGQGLRAAAAARRRHRLRPLRLRRRHRHERLVLGMFQGVTIIWIASSAS